MDRYGSDSGRYTSPVLNGKPFLYDHRALPYLEDVSQYHQYKVIGDFSRLKDYVNNCTDINLKNDIIEYVDTFYGGDFNKVVVYYGKIAPVNGWGTGGGLQFKMPMKVEWLIQLKLLQKIY